MGRPEMLWCHWLRTFAVLKPGDTLSQPVPPTRCGTDPLRTPCRAADLRSSIWPAVLIFAAALVLNGALRAEEDPEIVAKVSTEELYLGESLTLQIVEQDVEKPVKPDLTPLQADFAVQDAGERSLNQNSVVVINGRRTDRTFFGHVWQYTLTPKRSGQVTIPAITVNFEGKASSTQPTTLRVIAPELQDLVLTETVARPAKVFPTQPFEVALRVLVKPLPEQPRRDPLTPLRRQPPKLHANWIDPVPDGLSTTPVQEWLAHLQARDGTGFTINDIGSSDVFAFFERSLAVFDLSAGREKRKDAKGLEVEYFVYELKRTFVAQKEGTYTFGPANVKGTFVSAARGREYSGRQIYAIAEAKTVEVRGVPSPRPASFCGGIGKYAVAAQASPTTLRIGDPLSLTLTFTRAADAGSLELLSAPDLKSVEALTACFDLAAETPTGEAKGETKKFVYTLRPKKTGVGIPALPVTVFDPSTERFSEVTTTPLSLTVSEASQLKAGDLIASTGIPEAGKGAELRSRAEGIFQNVNSIAEIGNQQISPRWYLIASAVLLLGCAALCSGVLLWRRVSSNPAWQRRQAARGNADRLLSEARAALTSGRNEDALRVLRGAWTGLVADMRNLPAAGMTVHEASEALQKAGIAEPVRVEAGRLLDALDALEYGATSAGELGSALDSAEKLLPVLHKELSERK